MSSSVRTILLVTVALAALVAGVFVSRLWQTSRLEPATVPTEFAMTDLQGKARRLADWHGRVIVLNFWATWCGPCREEMPLLMRVHRNYSKKGVEVVGIAIDSPQAVASYAKELGVTYPLLIGETTGLQVMAQYGNTRGLLPYTVIINPAGEVVGKKLGTYKRGELEKVLDPLVSSRPK